MKWKRLRFGTSNANNLCGHSTNGIPCECISYERQAAGWINWSRGICICIHLSFVRLLPYYGYICRSQCSQVLLTCDLGQQSEHGKNLGIALFALQPFEIYCQDRNRLYSYLVFGIRRFRILYRFRNVDWPSWHTAFSTALGRSTLEQDSFRNQEMNRLFLFWQCMSNC